VKKQASLTGSMPNSNKQHRECFINQMTVILKIPKIYHSSDCFHALLDIWQKVNEHLKNDQHLEIDFQDCNFLSHVGVAFLGGLVYHTEKQGGKLTFKWETLTNRIRMNLNQNGFLSSFGEGSQPWDGNSVPYRKDDDQDENVIMDYLLNRWLGKGWVNISPPLQHLIAGKVWEIYANAFEHSQSSIGVFSCGQHYPRQKELHLTIVDFGQGIPYNVRSVSQNTSLNPAQSIEWALKPGNTTSVSTIGRGMGLDFLQGFISSNQGNLKIFSNEGYVNIKDNKVKSEIRSINFKGTLINIALKCDESYYQLASEGHNTDTPWF
jgi:hypothetical protein